MAGRDADSAAIVGVTGRPASATQRGLGEEQTIENVVQGEKLLARGGTRVPGPEKTILFYSNSPSTTPVAFLGAAFSNNFKRAETVVAVCGWQRTPGNTINPTDIYPNRSSTGLPVAIGRAVLPSTMLAVTGTSSAW